MKVVILAGGSGKRLWPLSREGFPKQFLSLGQKSSLFQATIERFLKIVNPQDIIVITNEDYQFHVKDQLKNIGQEGLVNIILEPIGRNTAAAIALAISYAKDLLGALEKEVIFISPSDHIIPDNIKFKDYVEKAQIFAQEGSIVTFGIKPFKPETGYGYIKKGDFLQQDEDIKNFRLECFTEKPDVDTAKQYLTSGQYFWNSGMFVFEIKTMLGEFSLHAPIFYQAIETGYQKFFNDFFAMPSISIDYAVMEKSKRASVVPLEILWSDIGCWDSVYELLAKDNQQNVKIGDVLTLETKNSLMFSDQRLIVTLGVEDLVVVETPDALLITKKGQSQKIRAVVDKLKQLNRSEEKEHTTTYRPWGMYTVLEEGLRYKIKRIVIYVGQKISLQLHRHRSEHWVVIKGTAKVSMDNKEKYLHENESIYVPKSVLHRVENVGKIPLEIIEVQNGEYVEEDDIERFEDIYGRKETNLDDQVPSK